MCLGAMVAVNGGPAMTTSFVGWIDYSEKEKSRMLDALSQFNQGTLDELGIGVVRDGLSDLLFPGVSTIQTRARYFLIIPWIYRRVEAKRKASRSSAALARDIEAQVTESLRKSPDAKNQGVIGIEAGAALQRPPSDIYWSGLRKWGVRLFEGSRDRYHRWLDQETRPQAPSEVAAESDNEEVESDRARTWHAGMPHPPAGFPTLDTLNLSPEEASYLREMILTNVPHSLLACLVRKPIDVSDSDLAWSEAGNWGLSPDLSQGLEAARRFSDLTYGALLFYNLLLSVEVKNELIADYQGELTKWGDSVLNSDLPRWDLRELWTIVEPVTGPVNPLTKEFVAKWQGLVADCQKRQAPVTAMAASADAQKLIRDREWSLKHGRARLGNPERLATWNGNSGAFALNYRWPVVKSHVVDIQRGVFRGA